MMLSFELTGTMPILFHADDIEAADALDEWRKRPEHKNISKAGDDRSPPWSWRTYLYSDGKHLTMPSACLMVALRNGGAKLIMKKQTSFKEVSQSGMLVTSEFCEFFGGDGKQVSMAKLRWQDTCAEGPGLKFVDECKLAESLGFKLFAKRAKVGQSKHIRVRARFNKWTIRGSVDVSAPELTFEVVSQIFDLAGKSGLGDWRPGCKTPGPFGMFTAKLRKAG